MEDTTQAKATNQVNATNRVTGKMPLTGELLRHLPGVTRQHEATGKPGSNPLPGNREYSSYRVTG